MKTDISQIIALAVALAAGRVLAVPAVPAGAAGAAVAPAAHQKVTADGKADGKAEPPADARRSPGALLDHPVQDFTLRTLFAADGQREGTVSVGRFKSKQHVVLFFFSEKCGHTKRYGKRVNEFVKKFAGAESADVVFLGVRSHADDTPESIRRFAKTLKFDFPVLDDPEGRVARYFKVQVAPTFIVIDKEGVLRYFGSFDNDDGHGYGANYGPSQYFLADAVSAIRSGEPVLVKRALPFG